MLSYEVYKITNKVNGKIYIGITNKGAGNRFKQHLYETEHGSQFKIHRALRKYGKDNFSLEIIDFCNNAEELKEKEKYYISKYNSTDDSVGYNMTEGGDGTFGRVQTEETKRKISEANTGRIISEETRQKLSEAGKVKSEKREAYRHSGKIGESRKKSILQYDENGNFIKEFSGVNQAGKETGIGVSLIISSLKRRNVLKSEKNPYIWVYKSDYPDTPSQIDKTLIALFPDWKPTISEKCRQANIEARKNKIYTEEELQKRKEIVINSCGKAVCQYTKTGEFVAEYRTITEASKASGQDRKSITNQCEGKTDYNKKAVFTRLKYIWKYKNNVEVA